MNIKRFCTQAHLYVCRLFRSLQMVVKLTEKAKNSESVTIGSYTSQHTLKSVYQILKGDKQSDIPFMIWLWENPQSFLPFPGKIDLCRHDYLHILLERRFSLDDEAFVIGFTMGNDLKTKSIHCLILKFISKYFYPPSHRFSQKHFWSFDLGFSSGSKTKIKNLNQLDFSVYEEKTISEIRKELGIDVEFSDLN